ncbi:hypothetical protein [Micromonospora sp. DT47]|uniref:hypothetical protein n=1 Tax=Micromonospora sp. DT47 TaxID=3393431 RepID=UPI003CF40DD5
MDTDSEVERAWHRIEDWLSRYAPRFHAQLNPPDTRAEMERFVASQNSQPAGTMKGGLYWLPRWLPVAGDGMGGGLFMDLREGPLHGCLVEFTREDHAGTPRWESLTQLWAEVADLLDAAAVELDRRDHMGELIIGRWRPPIS